MPFTYDAQTIDSSGVFLISELERLDPTIYEPLVDVTWQRDIDLRTDVTIADEASSYTNALFASAGGDDEDGISFVSGDSTEITGIDIALDKTTRPMRLWGKQLGYSVIELAAAQQLGRPLDTTKFNALRLKHHMDVDRMVYVGSPKRKAYGLVNNPAIPPVNVAAEWDGASPEQKLEDINQILYAAYERSAFAAAPTDLLLPPNKFGLLTMPVSSAGSISILKYVSEQCFSALKNGRPLNIKPLKWLIGRGVGGTNRAVAYSKNEQYVRYPLVPLQHTPLEHRGLYQITTYYGRLGEVEFVKLETLAYADGM